jgi:glycosyltransferase involved in cell wall biosynthesis
MSGKVVVVYLGDLANHARVHRQITFLASEYEVAVASFAPPPPGVGGDWVRLSEAPPRGKAGSAMRAALRAAGRYETAYWRDPQTRAWRDELEPLMPADAIVVNQLYALPLAFAAGRGAAVVFDAHEHWTSESASWDWRSRLSMRGAHDWIAETFVPRTGGMTTVSMGIARDFEQRTGVRAELVTNAPVFHELEPTPVHEPIRLLHFGMADERRRLEDSIEAVQSLGDRFTFDLILERENDYRRRLEQVAAKDERVRILPPVPSEQLLGIANDYDVGVFLLPARFPNQLHVLPNKLFDFIQARLAVAIGPSPEMAAIVEQWECGVVSSTFEPESFAEALGGLTTESVTRMKSNADRAARVLNAEANRETIMAVVKQAIDREAANIVAPS